MLVLEGKRKLCSLPAGGFVSLVEDAEVKRRQADGSSR